MYLFLHGLRFFPEHGPKSLIPEFYYQELGWVCEVDARILLKDIKALLTLQLQHLLQVF